jgi:hypothetical protein
MQRRIVVLVSVLIALFMAETVPFSLSASYGAPTFVATYTHHVAQLTYMPYVAGFQVYADDLSEYLEVSGTAVTASFDSTQPEYFPADSWLGCGMFVQAQDHYLYNVDYGFYMMLVIDSSGTMFIDVGLHQTEEASEPIQAANSTLVYCYTWLVKNVDKSAEVELFQTWLNSTSVRYSVSVSGLNQTLADINVKAMPNCNNIIPKFYAGNVIMGESPFVQVDNFFQFGIISNATIDNSHWQADIENPMMLMTNRGWDLANKAWLLDGDHSFIDQNARWGGEAYPGISVTPNVEQSKNLYQLSFKYTGKQYSGSKTLWSFESNSTGIPFETENQNLTITSRRLLPIIAALFAGIIIVPYVLISRKTRRHRVKC